MPLRVLSRPLALGIWLVRSSPSSRQRRWSSVSPLVSRSFGGALHLIRLMTGGCSSSWTTFCDCSGTTSRGWAHPDCLTTWLGEWHRGCALTLGCFSTRTFLGSTALSAGTVLLIATFDRSSASTIHVRLNAGPHGTWAAVGCARLQTIRGPSGWPERSARYLRQIRARSRAHYAADEDALDLRTSGL